MDMRDGRYYPTNVAHGDGSTYLFAGRDPDGGDNPEVERFVPNGGPSGEDQLQYISGADNAMVWYPRMHLLSDGRIARVGEEEETEVFDPQTGDWDTVAVSDYGDREWGTSVALPPSLDRIMILGGYDSGTFATDTTEIIDLSDPSPDWSYGPSMFYRRMHVNVITLPDGKVFVAGGTEDENQTISAFYSEMYDPETNAWTLMAPQDSARIYHSSSILLPDARVMWLGAYADTGDNKNPTAQVYSPPYLFAGPRPTVASAPSSADYGASFDIGTPDASEIEKVVLIQPSATTHSANMAQRYVELPFTQVNGSTLRATVPSNRNVAPPSYYMLFLVNDEGVPSEAPFVRIGGTLPPRVEAGDDQTVILPAPAQLDATVTSGSNLVTTWSAVNPPGAVTFADADAVDTTASFSGPGDYVLRLTAEEGGAVASDTVTITVLPIGSVAPIDVRVAFPDDDAEEKAGGDMSLGSSDIDLLAYDPAPHDAVGLRFTNLDIPAGAQIVAAWVEFTADEGDDVPTTLEIRAEADTNASPFTTANGNITSRPTTQASATWNVPAWGGGESGPATRSPTLAAVVQEVVSLPGWASGNALALVITDLGGGSQRVAESYDSSPGEAALLHVEFTTVAVCDDGSDNDADGLTDFPDDPGCEDTSDATEQSAALVCDDGLDNDGDGLVDHPEDPGCGGDPRGASEGSQVTACSDGLDNDGDGFTDTIDPGCDSADDTSENSPAYVCDDGLDNDGDGVADFPSDPGCQLLLDASERQAGLVCDDGLDNDGDTFADAPDDPGCSGPLDGSETDAGLICDDGVDNDGDGDIDYPADTGCTDPSDDTEVDLTSIAVSVATDEDDAEQKADGSITLTSSDLEMHEYDGGARHQAVGLRFVGVPIPPGATIASAYVQFEADNDDDVPATLTLETEQTANAPPLTTAAGDLTSRVHSDAQVSWLVDPWVEGDAGPAERTADISPLIQEVVDLPDWAVGNAIVVLITPDARPIGGRVAKSADGGVPPVLHVDYALLTPACNNGEDDDGLVDHPEDPGCASADDHSELNGAVACDDGTDNDGDGVIDTADPGCDDPADTSEQDPSGAACDDGQDNDGDGLVDAADPGCAGPGDGSERQVGLVCDDGQDNDGDGKIDYPEDPGCDSPPDSSEADPVASACDDGQDNDDDGLTDSNDPGCADAADDDERGPDFACDDGNDNDGDALFDYPDDPGCTGPTDGDEADPPSPACDDGQDNDGDGLVDAADPGCTDPNDGSERQAGLVCDDGQDQDGDGLADHPADPGCSGPGDGSEQDPAGPACDDGSDNDGDGLVDAADPGCTGPGDGSERQDGLICDDGQDNDGDGDIDYPADTGCASPTGGSEDDVTNITVPIATGADDAEEKANGSITFTSKDLEMHEYNATGPHRAVGLRFASVPIPAGASIATAYVQFEAAESDGAPATYTVEAEKTTNAPALTNTNSDLTSRTRTNAQVAWAAGPWTEGSAGPAERTDDLSPLVQELVYQPGWAAGNALVLLVTPNGPIGERVAGSFNSGAPPTLHVSYAVTAACDDGVDNDGDGLSDLLDPGCTDASDPSERDGSLACDDGSDGDGDGLVDYPADPGCNSPTDGSEQDPAGPACDDGVDNDGDGLSDAADPGCTGPGDDSERQAGLACDDGQDNDGDGDVDYPADADCAGPGDASEDDLTSVALAIATGAGDAEEKADGSITLTSDDLEMHDYGSSPPHRAVGLRFTGVPIPAGASIVSAYVQFEAADSDASAASYIVEGEKSANAPPLTTANSDLTARPRTNAQVVWTAGAWSADSAGPSEQTDDISTLVQEVVDEPGWAAGNALVILVTPNGPIGERAAKSFDNGGPPTLHVEFSLP
jgi:hypothetical protein